MFSVTKSSYGEQTDDRMRSTVPAEEKVAGNPEGTKMEYKSFKYVSGFYNFTLSNQQLANIGHRKKYRKMKIKFEETMNLNNQLFREVYEAEETAERLKLENEFVQAPYQNAMLTEHSQLLELLLDVNNSTQIPGRLRIDLSLDVPALDDAVNLISEEELKTIKCDTEQGQMLHNELRSMLEARMLDKVTNKPTKSLASLIASTPHRPFTLAPMPGLGSAELQDLSEEHPISYLSPSDIDDNLSAIDASLKLPPAPTMHEPSPRVRLSDRELNMRNPHSVYNWLRKHEPKIFLQDGEGSEKSAAGKVGALRGAGKRANLPTPCRPDMVEFVEDGIGYDGSLNGPGGGGRGKRKRISDEDAGYRPKGGSSKPTKKKRKDLIGESVGADRGSGLKTKGKSEVDLESSTMDMDT